MKEEEETEVQILGRKSANANNLNNASEVINDEEQGLIKAAATNDNDNENREITSDKCDNKYISYVFEAKKGICDCEPEFNNQRASKILPNFKQQERQQEHIHFKDYVCKNANESMNMKNTPDVDSAACDENVNLNRNSAADAGMLNNELVYVSTLKNSNYQSEASTLDTIFCCETSKEYFYNRNSKSSGILIADKTCSSNSNFNNNNYSNKFLAKADLTKVNYINNRNDYNINLNESDKQESYMNSRKIKIAAETDTPKDCCNYSINIFFKIFFLIFFSEIGDRSQISTIYLTTNFDKFSVIVAVLVASTALTIIAVFGGSLLADKISEKKLTIFAGGIFIVFGLVALYLLFFSENVNEAISSQPAAGQAASVVLNSTLISNTTNKIKHLIVN